MLVRLVRPAFPFKVVGEKNQKRRKKRRRGEIPYMALPLRPPPHSRRRPFCLTPPASQARQNPPPPPSRFSLQLPASRAPRTPSPPADPRRHRLCCRHRLAFLAAGWPPSPARTACATTAASSAAGRTCWPCWLRTNRAAPIRLVRKIRSGEIEIESNRTQCVPNTGE